MIHMNKIKLSFFSFLVSLASLGVVGLANVNAAATPAPVSNTSAACDALHQLDPSHECGPKGDSGVSSIIKAVVSILSYIVGVAAVFMVILAGFKYVTSSGDSGRISSAKSTLVYALVGLAIAALAQVLVHLVLTDATKAANGAKITKSATISQTRIPT